MQADHLRVRTVVPWGLLLLVVAVLAAPHGRLDDASHRLGGVAVAAARTAGPPAAALSTSHPLPDPPSSVALPLGTLAGAVLLVLGLGVREAVRAAAPVRRRLLAALRPGRSPPLGARSRLTTAR